MGEMTSYTAGTPNWIDVASPDMEGAIRFYCTVFGWEHETTGPVEETGGYGMFTLGGKNVAGIGPHQPGGPPPMWSVYISTDDADATAAAVKDAGGTVLMEVMDVMDAGRMTFAMDPSGAAFGIWQPKEHIGCQLVNDPGTFCWAELNTRENDEATAFYAAVFGWTHDQHPKEEGQASGYIEYSVGDDVVAGCMDMRGIVPDEVPAHWLPYIAVADVDRTLADIVANGGSQTVPVMEIDPGRFALAADPWGAWFAVITMREAPPR